MPKRSSNKSQQRRQKSAIKKLRDVGLIPRNTDLRRKPSKGTLGALKRFGDVVTGKAAAVKTTGKRAKELGAQYKRKGNIVVIPREKGERFRTDKEGRIFSKHKVGRRTIEKQIVTDKEALAGKPRKGFKRVYGIHFKSIGWQKFDDIDELKAFMQGYEPPKSDKWPNIASYVTMVDIPLSREDDEDLIDEKLEAKEERRINRRSKAARRRS